MKVISRTRITIECIDYAIQPNTRSRDFFPVRIHVKEPFKTSGRGVFHFRRGLWRELEYQWCNGTMKSFLKCIKPDETIDICFDKENGVILKLNEFILLNNE